MLRDLISLAFRVTRIKHNTPETFLQELEQVRQGGHRHQLAAPFTIFQHQATAFLPVAAEVYDLGPMSQQAGLDIADTDSQERCKFEEIAELRLLERQVDVTYLLP